MTIDAHRPTSVIFDLGAVLIDWNPRYLYRQLFDDEAEIERFLAEVCTPDWNHSLDAGRSFAEAITEKIVEFPDFKVQIEAYHDRWIEMISGPISESVELLERLYAKGVPLFALTNWSAQTFRLIRQDPEFEFLNRFRSIIVSGEIKLVKPDPAIFEYTLGLMAAEPQDCLFIDDNPANCASASAMGIVVHQFVQASDLAVDLKRHGLLPD